MYISLRESLPIYRSCCFLPFLSLVLSRQSGLLWSLTPLCPIVYGCRINRLLLCRGVRPLPNERPVYDTKQSNGEVPVMLTPRECGTTLSLPSLPGPLWLGVEAPDKGPIYGSNRTKPWLREFTVFAFKQRIYALLKSLK